MSFHSHAVEALELVRLDVQYHLVIYYVTMWNLQPSIFIFMVRTYSKQKIKI